MFDHISYINNNSAEVKLKDGVPLQGNIMNLHVMFEDDDKKILGEVEDITKDSVKINFLGEVVNGKFVGGVLRKPKLSATIRVITEEEIKMMIDQGEEKGTIKEEEKELLNNVLNYALSETLHGYIELNVNTIIKNDVCRLMISVEDSSTNNNINTITKDNKELYKSYKFVNKLKLDFSS